MTRGNLNFIYQLTGEAPRTLFFYHNGDQYPSGLKDYFGVLELVKEKITPERFKKWIKKYYKGKVKDLGAGGQPKVCYTNGFLTDYTYVFTADDDVVVWNFYDKIFEGKRTEFIKWIKQQKD